MRKEGKRKAFEEEKEGDGNCSEWGKGQLKRGTTN